MAVPRLRDALDAAEGRAGEPALELLTSLSLAAALQAVIANRFACLLQPPFSYIGLPGSLFSLTLLIFRATERVFWMNPRFFDKGAFSHSRRSALVQNRPRRLASIVR